MPILWWCLAQRPEVGDSTEKQADPISWTVISLITAKAEVCSLGVQMLFGLKCSMTRLVLSVEFSTSGRDQEFSYWYFTGLWHLAIPPRLRFQHHLGMDIGVCGI